MLIYETELEYAAELADDDITEIMAEADRIIASGEENPQKRALACVKKFRCLEQQHTLAPRLLEKALEWYPDMPQALAWMGFFYQHTNKTEDALECVNKSIQADPSYAYAWLILAELQTGKEETLAAYANFIRLRPDIITGYEKCGSYMRDYIWDKKYDKKLKKLTKDDFQVAVDNFSKIIEFNPSDYSNFLERGELYLLRESIFGEEEDQHKAVADIGKFLLMCPQNNLDQYTGLFGNVFSDVSTARKIRYFSEMIQELPSNTGAYWLAFCGLMKAYSSKRNCRKAVAGYTSMIEQNTDGSAWQLLGYAGRAEVYEQTRNDEEALEDYAAIIRLGYGAVYRKTPWDINPIHAHQCRAQIYEWHKYRSDYDRANCDKAIAEYTAIIDISNKSDNDLFWCCNAYEDRANLYKEQNDFDKALDDYSAIIRLRIEHPDAHVPTSTAYKERIEIYKMKGEMDKAFNDYVKMAEVKDDVFGPDAWTEGYKILEG
jgi:tetratricopeptide (TPR) repeat protein